MIFGMVSTVEFRFQLTIVDLESSFYKCTDSIDRVNGVPVGYPKGRVARTNG